jgi:hypothetical protein
MREFSWNPCQFVQSRGHPEFSWTVGGREKEEMGYIANTLEGVGKTQDLSSLMGFSCPDEIFRGPSYLGPEVTLDGVVP